MEPFKLGLCLILMHWTLVGCQSGFESPNANKSSLTSPSVSQPGLISPDNPQNDSGALTPDLSCFEDPEVNACLFYKNPVEANQGPFVNPVDMASDLRGLQTFGVNLHGTDSSGYLQNSNVRINITSGVRIQKTAQNDWKYEYNKGEVNKAVAQLSAYHALNTTIDFLIERGGNPTDGVQIRVDAVDLSIENNAYFTIATGAIKLGYASNDKVQQEVALSSEVVIHEYGHAAIYHSSHGGMSFYNDQFNKWCTDSEANICCTDSNGCAGALDEGAADVLAQIMFPDSPSIGNALSNTSEGMDSLGISRNVDIEKDLTALEAYNAPGKMGFGKYNGEIHTLGIAYSSAWRLAWLAAEDEGTEREIEEIFLEHLSAMTGNDTFVTMLEKILLIDETFYASKHRQKFLNAFAAKGIQPSEM